jgi:autotransporter-associated beta strand protein
VTISAWVYRTASESNWAGIVFDRNSSSGASGLNFGAANELRYNWNNASATWNWNSGMTVPASQWTFVALVVTASNATMYMQPLGGALQSATNAVANSASNFDSTSYIGQDTLGGNRFFSGTLDDVRIYKTSLSASAIASIANLAPTVATAAHASPSPAAGTTANLSVLGADSDGGGEPNLTYTWSTTGTPPAAVSFSINGANAAKNTTATFTKFGTYSFLVTITDLGGQSTSSPVSVTVNQTLTGIVASPGTAALGSNATQQFAATAYDQFGAALASQPTFAWAVASGVGSIDNLSGLYTAAYASGSATITASSGNVTSSPAAVTITDAAPTVSTAAAGSPSPAAGTTTNLSVLGADSDGGGETNLSYTWSTTGTPPAAVSFSANGTNAAKNTTATFTVAGTYNFLVTITDLGGQLTTSPVSVTVNQTLTSIAVSPSTAGITAGGSQQFTVSGQDQFGAPVTNPPVTWSLTGPGSLSGGLYTPAYAAGTATVQAANGSLVSTASVTVSGEAQWNSATDASWGAAGSWADSVSGTTIAAPGVRGIAGDTVLFAAAAGGTASLVTASLDSASPALAGITFDNATTSYAVVPGSGGSITLQAAGAATVSVLSGNHAIAAPLVLAGGANFAATAGTRLTISGNISGGGGLTKSGGGVVELSGSNSYAGDTAVAAGKLIVDHATALPDGGNLTIGNAGFFASPSVPAPLPAAASQPPAAGNAPAAATIAPPSLVTSPAVVAARAKVLKQAGVATAVPARTAAAWVSRIAAPAGGGFDADASSADQNARIRDAIFAGYARS